MCAYERGPVAKTVYSDNQNNVDALAERLSSQTSLSAERAKLVAYDLLCRKALKIKSSALAQIFRSVDKECDTKAMRDELIAANIVTKIEGSGINGPYGSPGSHDPAPAPHFLRDCKPCTDLLPVPMHLP